MAVVVLDDVKKRVIAILGANPGVWSTTVSGTVGAFPSDAEILEAILEADEWVVNMCYLQSVNPELTQGFITSSAVANGGAVPFHHGKLDNVTVDTGSGFVKAIEARNIDDITNASGTDTYVGAGSTGFLYKIENGNFYSTASGGGTITYPLYTRTSVPQCNQNETALLVFRTVAILAKNASPALFEYYDNKANQGQQQIIQDGSYMNSGDN